MRVRLYLGLVVALAATHVLSDVPSRLDDQRAIFRGAWAAAEKGQWNPSAAETRLLRQYVLWPDLRGRYLESRIHELDHQEIESFLQRYDKSPAARSLRYRYSQTLYRQKQWRRFLSIYESHYAQLDQTRLNCQAVAAQITGRSTINGALALKLWRVGRSQPDACDPVFEWLRDNDLLTKAEYQARFELAIDGGQYNLARWLAKHLDANQQAQAARWIALRDQPQQALQRELKRLAKPSAPHLIYGFSRLARVSTEQAWQTFHDDFAKPLRDHAKTRAAILEQIALVSAWRHEAQAGERMDAIPIAMRGAELSEWRVRAALRAQDWPAVLAAIGDLAPDLRQSDRWRYWAAIAEQQIGGENEAKTAFSAIATERSYYGFLAADQLGADYAFAHRALAGDKALLTELAKNPQLVRARELFEVGLFGRGRSEWDRATRPMETATKRQAAVLAHQWGWHSRAIAAAASAGGLDDLVIRYPRPWPQAFARYADRNEIPVDWAYGIARSESLFMQDVRSSAGAIGLMQLMPATGKATARKEKLRYEGIPTLTHAETNIRLGTRYLADMAQRFDGQQILATAAYNAGPHRVDRWIEDLDRLPATIWIETIPFDETRGYVQRVLAAQAVFHWRRTDSVQRISGLLRPVSGPEQTAQMASKNTAAGS